MKRRPRRNFHEGHLHNKEGCTTTTIFVLVIVISMAVFIGLTGIGGIIIASVVKPKTCKIHDECITQNPCSEDKCDMEKHICVHTKISGCCVQDPDCGSSPCYNAFCDKNQCVVSPTLNGTICDDYNDCTVNDRCSGSVCKGNILLCNTGSSCSSGTCVKGTGCIFTNKRDGESCDDFNKCTIGDVCWNGQCASGIMKDCSAYDSECSRGVCDTNTGQCISVSKNDGKICDDGYMCTINDVCNAGTCSGVENTCIDNNPCTINKCVEGIGCMLQYQDYNKTCLSCCHSDNDCPEGYMCNDGTCIKLDAPMNAQIRFLDYAIEACAGTNYHRLVLDFAFDSQSYQIGNDTRYIIPYKNTDIFTVGYPPLGFIKDIRSLQTIQISSDYIRTGFTLTTECQNVTQVNCDTIFSMRSYEFFVKVHHCTSTFPTDDICIDTNSIMSAHVDLSLSDCTGFDQYQHIPLYGVGVAYVDGVKYTGVNEGQIITTATSNLIVGYESPVYDHPSFRTMTTGMRFCKAKLSHYLRDCVSGLDPNCKVTGCFNWDPNDSPLEEYYDVVNGSITALAKGTLGVTSCYLEDNYNAPLSQKCSEHKCPNTTNGNVNNFPDFDDGFKLGIDTFRSGGFKDSLWTFDFKFRLYACSNTLRNDGSEYHNIISLNT